MTEIITTPNTRETSQFVRSLHLTEPSATYSTLRLVGFLGAWPALYVLGRSINAPELWIVIWALQALLFEGFNIGTHEAAHNNMFKSRSANYFAGVLWAVPIIYNFAAYRSSHLEHHANTHDPDRDSEVIVSEWTITNYLLYMAFSGLAYTVILISEGIKATLGRGPSWMSSGNRRRRALFATIRIGLELALLTFGFYEAPRLTIELWLIPFLLYSTVLAPMVTHPEHTNCGYGPAPAFETTRTTYSNRFISFFIWNINLHTAHHLVPSVPGQKLRQLQQHVDPYCRHLSRSYWKWHTGFLHDLLTEKRTSTSDKG